MDPLSKGRQAAEEERRVRGSGATLGPFAWGGVGAGGGKETARRQGNENVSTKGGNN